MFGNSIAIPTVLGTVIGMGVLVMMYVDKRIDAVEKRMDKLEESNREELREVQRRMDRLESELKAEIREIRQFLMKFFEVPKGEEK